jgi:hypothetical protein
MEYTVGNALIQATRADGMRSSQEIVHARPTHAAFQTDTGTEGYDERMAAASAAPVGDAARLPPQAVRASTELRAMIAPMDERLIL